MSLFYTCELIKWLNTQLCLLIRVIKPFRKSDISLPVFFYLSWPSCTSCPCSRVLPPWLSPRPPKFCLVCFAHPSLFEEENKGWDWLLWVRQWLRLVTHLTHTCTTSLFQASHELVIWSTIRINYLKKIKSDLTRFQGQEQCEWKEKYVFFNHSVKFVVFWSGL